MPTFWTRELETGASWRAETLDAALRLNGSGARVTIVPIAPRDGVIAVALVPDDQASRVAMNGTPAAAGLAVLRHGDALEADGVEHWVSSSAAVEHTCYAAAEHGPDARCFITKARLSEGEAIAICPGVPDRMCGTIYKRDAWQLAFEKAQRFRCPSCGYDPRAAAWQPPDAKPGGTLDDLLALFRED